MVSGTDWVVVAITGATGILGALLGAAVTWLSQARSEKSKRTLAIVQEMRSPAFIDAKATFLALLQGVEKKYGDLSEGRVQEYLALMEKSDKGVRITDVSLKFTYFENYILGLCGLIEKRLVDEAMIASQHGATFRHVGNIMRVFYNSDPEYNSWKLRKISALERVVEQDQLEPYFPGKNRWYSRH
jgi:hypothetical protein